MLVTGTYNPVLKVFKDVHTNYSLKQALSAILTCYTVWEVSNNNIKNIKFFMER